MNYHQIAHYYDLIHAKLTGDIELVLSLASGESKKILDLGCGTGRIAIPLARAGHSVDGIDLSKEMLNLARTKLDREPEEVQLSVSLTQGDMTDFDFEQRYDLVLISQNTLHEHARKQVYKIFRLIQKHLAPSGILFLDLSNPFTYFSHQEGDNIWIEDQSFQDPETGYLIHQRSSVSIELTDQKVRILRTLKAVPIDATLGETYTHESTYHLLYPHQVELLLGAAGMRIAQIYGGYERESFGDNSQRFIVLASLRVDSGVRT